MPIITQTVESDSMVEKYKQLETAFNMIKAVAACMGTYPNIITDSSNSAHKTYYVNMDPIGYPGWCFLIDMDRTSSSDNTWRCQAGVYTVTNGKPNITNIGVFCNGKENIDNIYSGIPETCVMIFDEERNTVLFDLHHGKGTHGEGLSLQSGTTDYWLMMYTFFFARDVNNDVLAGFGRNYITALRTKDKTLYGFTDTQSRLHPDFKDVLHLTKMVNYLSPGYPEMKSAYTSVVRPDEDINITGSGGNQKKRVSLKDINGVKWGSAGTTAINLGIANGNSEYLYYPINPYVKY